MKVEEKFNKRSAEFVETLLPIVHVGPQYAEGIKVTFHARHPEYRSLAMHMTPAEALDIAAALLLAVKRGMQ